MYASVQILIGAAAAGLVTGLSRPSGLLIGAVAGVLPDVIDWWAHVLVRRPGLVITPDPADPDPRVVAEGLHAAMRAAHDKQKPCLLRLNPVPDGDGGHIDYAIDYTREHRLMAVFAAPVNRAACVGSTDLEDPASHVSPQHVLPLRIAACPLDLLLVPSRTRLETHDLARRAEIGHSILLLGALALAAAVWQWRVGLAAAAAFTAHWLVDAGGRRHAAPWLPFSRRLFRGRRRWDDRGTRANAIAALLAGMLLAILIHAG